MHHGFKYVIFDFLYTVFYYLHGQFWNNSWGVFRYLMFLNLMLLSILYYVMLFVSWKKNTDKVLPVLHKKSMKKGYQNIFCNDFIPHHFMFIWFLTHVRLFHKNDNKKNYENINVKMIWKNQNKLYVDDDKKVKLNSNWIKGSIFSSVPKASFFVPSCLFHIIFFVVIGCIEKFYIYLFINWFH